jgi:DNA processing protein
MSDACDIVDLVSISKLTEPKLFHLLQHFKSPQAIKEADFASLSSVVGADIARAIRNVNTQGAPTGQRELLEKLNIQVVPYYSDRYPPWLRMIDHFPPVLFVRGDIKPVDEVSLAVIGTRGATVYGKTIADTFAREFADVGVTVVSGMARGIDTAAHRGALKSNGRTIAVLGCGIDICYPPENKKLMEQIIEHGAVISEFPLGTPPLAQNFPKRNRIVSGLSKAIVAIEAKEKSGVMNTIRWALDQNKDVFAIPGNIFSKASQGTNLLIKDGAIPVTSASEVLESLGIQHTKTEREMQDVELDGSEKQLWEALGHEPVYLDLLSERLEQPTGSILNILLGLEMKGLVKQLPGMMFVKNLE